METTRTIKKSISLSVLAAAISTVSMSASAAGSPPYQYAGSYEFSNCTENTEAYVAVNISAGDFVITSGGSSTTVHYGGETLNEKIDIPFQCDANGHLTIGSGNTSEVVAEIATLCDEMLPPDPSLTIDMNSVVCPALVTGISELVSFSNQQLPQVVTLQQEAQISELTGVNELYRTWLGGSWEGLVSTQNTRYDGSTFDLNTPIQSYGAVRSSNTDWTLRAAGGLVFGNGNLVCGYATKDLSRPSYYTDYLMYFNEYRNIFECVSTVDGQPINIDIEPVIKAEYRMDKVQ